MVKYSVSFLVPRNFFHWKNSTEKNGYTKASYMDLLLCSENLNNNTEIKQATPVPIQLLVM